MNSALVPPLPNGVAPAKPARSPLVTSLDAWPHSASPPAAAVVSGAAVVAAVVSGAALVPGASVATGAVVSSASSSSEPQDAATNARPTSSAPTRRTRVLVMLGLPLEMWVRARRLGPDLVAAERSPPEH